MKTIQKLLLSCALVCAALFSANAQPHGPCGPKSPEERLERLIGALRLDESKAEAVREVFESRADNFEALRKEGRTLRRAHLAKRGALRAEIRAELAEILTPAQLARLEEKMDARRPRFEDGREERRGRRFRERGPRPERMAEELGLNETQRRLVREIFDARKADFEALRAEGRKNRETMQAKKEALRKEIRDELAGVLSRDELKRLDELQEARERRGGYGREHGPEARAERLIRALGLEGAQADNVRAALEARAPEAEALRSEAREQWRAHRAARRELRARLRAEIAEVLTPEQRAKHQANRETRRAERGFRGAERPAPEARLARMTEELGLTEAQQARVRDILAAHNNERAALCQQVRETHALMREKREALQARVREDLARLLSPEQLQRLDELHDARKRRCADRRRPRPCGAPQAPKAPAKPNGAAVAESAATDVANAGRKNGTAPAAEELQVFPNPAQGSFNLSFQAEGGAPALVKLTDPTGRVVFRQSYDVGEGAQTLNVSLESVGPGAYVVEVAQGGRRMFGSVIAD